MGLAAAMMAGCGGSAPAPAAPVTVQSVTVNPSAVSLIGSNQTASVVATVISSGQPVPAIAWQSDNPSIAGVTGSGASAVVTSLSPGTTTIRATSAGIQGSASVTVSAAPDVGLNVAPTTVVQGGTTATTLRIARTNFLQSVQLSASGAPPGVTVSFAPAAVTADSSIVTIVAATSAVPGAYSVTISAAAGLLSPRTVVLPLTITAAPTSGNVVVDLKRCAEPNGWMAMQDGTGAPWTRVFSNAGIYSFTPTAQKIGIVYQAPTTQGARTSIHYLLATEVATLLPEQLCELLYVPIGVTTKRTNIPLTANTIAFSGWIGGWGEGIVFRDTARVNVPFTGIHDMGWTVAERPFEAPYDLRLLMRRGISVDAVPPDGILTAPLDASGVDAAVLPTARYSWVGPSDLSIRVFRPLAIIGRAPCFPVALPIQNGGVFGLKGWRSTSTFIFAASVRPWELSLDPFQDAGLAEEDLATGIPAALRRAGDLHGVMTYAGRGGGFLGGAIEQRMAIETFASFADRSISIPSGLSGTAPTVVDQTHYTRLRFQFTTPVDLDDAVQMTYGDTYSIYQPVISIRMTRGYLGGRTVDVTTPDFSSIAGWRNDFAPNAATPVKLYKAQGEKSTRTQMCSAGRTALSITSGTY